MAVLPAWQTRPATERQMRAKDKGVKRGEELCGVGVSPDPQFSNYTEYYLVAEYLARYSAAEIALPVGIMNFVELFREERYSHLSGGLLEAMGRLMGQGVQIYVYPGLDPKTGERVELDGLELSAEVRTLFHYLLERGSVQGLEGLPDDMLSVGSDQVYAWIGEGDPRWEENVLPEVVRAIKAGNLFGYQG